MSRAQETRAAVQRLREQGFSYRQICAELGLAKSTVAYHVRRLGSPPDERFARRYDWVAVQHAVDSGASYRDCARIFGMSSYAWTAAVKRGDLVPRQWIIPLEELLVAGPRRNRDHIKRRLLSGGLKEQRCEQCGITHWQGEQLSMQLHHINGDGNDNRLENLAMLCANCHSLTPTYGARGIQRVPAND